MEPFLLKTYSKLSREELLALILDRDKEIHGLRNQLMGLEPDPALKDELNQAKK